MQAGVLNAQEMARTKVNTVSADAEEGDNLPFAKQPRLSEHVEHEEDLEEDIYSSASRWQASEDLSTFIETFRKPLQPFEWKAIYRKFPRPDVDVAYTPLLDECLSSLIPGIKQADKDGKFIHDRILDPVGPMVFLYEHLNEILSASKEQGTVLLSSDQLQGLFNASAHGLRLLGNASALLAKEHRSTVQKKINAKGSLTSLATEEFPDAEKSLFGSSFEERLNARSETAKTLLQAANVSCSQQFFRGRTTPSRFRGG